MTDNPCIRSGKLGDMSRRRRNRGYRKDPLSVGAVFHSLEIIGESVKAQDGTTYYPCMCRSCGRPCFIRKGLLGENGQKSCGCGRGRTKHGWNRTRLYVVWSNMRARCLNPSDKAYPNYGGRGIGIDESWDEFSVFRDWALGNGYTDDLTLDRIDNDGPYSPGNSRWADKKTQANNTRSCRFFTYEGETKTLKQWSEDPRCLVPYGTLYARVISNGKPFDRALVEPRFSRF